MQAWRAGNVRAEASVGEATAAGKRGARDGARSSRAARETRGTGARFGYNEQRSFGRVPPNPSLKPGEAAPAVSRKEHVMSVSVQDADRGNANGAAGDDAPCYTAADIAAKIGRELPTVYRLDGVLQPEPVKVRNNGQRNGVFGYHLENRYRPSKAKAIESCFAIIDLCAKKGVMDPVDGHFWVLQVTDRDKGTIELVDLCVGGDMTTRRTLPEAAKKFNVTEGMLRYAIERPIMAAKAAAARAAKAAKAAAAAAAAAEGPAKVAADRRVKAAAARAARAAEAAAAKEAAAAGTSEPQRGQLKSNLISAGSGGGGGGRVRIVSDRDVKQFLKDITPPKFDPEAWKTVTQLWAMVAKLISEQYELTLAEQHELSEQVDLWILQEKLKAWEIPVERSGKSASSYRRSEEGKRIVQEAIDTKKIYFERHCFVPQFWKLWNVGPEKDVEFIREQIRNGPPKAAELLAKLKERGCGRTRRQRLLRLAGAVLTWHDGERVYRLNHKTPRPRPPRGTRPVKEIADWITEQLEADGPLLDSVLIDRAKLAGISKNQRLRGFHAAGDVMRHPVARSSKNPPGLAYFLYLKGQTPPTDEEALRIIEEHERNKARDSANGQVPGGTNGTQTATPATPPAASPPGSPLEVQTRIDYSSWLTVSKASLMSAIATGTISRAANKGELKTNGKEGRERRLDPSDFSQWALARMRKPESDESVARNVARNVVD
jgi:hypothetical protein